MNVTKHLAPPIEVVFIRPHTSKCTIPKGLVARVTPSLGNGTCVCFPSMQSCHVNDNWITCPCKRYMLVTINRNVFKLLTFKCPSWRCHNYNLSSLEFDCAYATNSGRCTFANLIWYKLLTSSIIAISSQLIDITKHPSSLNSIHKCFETKCYIDNRFAFNLDIINTSFIMMVLGWALDLLVYSNWASTHGFKHYIISQNNPFWRNKMVQMKTTLIGCHMACTPVSTIQSTMLPLYHTSLSMNAYSF